jgi:hypothetical protein
MYLPAKVKSFMKFSYLFVFTLMVTEGFGQTDYAVTNKGDTVKGVVRILSYDQKLDRIQIATGRNKVDFTALEAPFLFVQGEEYVTQRHESSFIYMKPLIKGYLSLFAFRLGNQYHYDGQQLIKLNGQSIEVPNLKFKSIMADFLEDCEGVRTQLKQGTLKRKNLEAIISAYNTCMNQQTEAVVQVEENKPNAANDLINALRDRVMQAEFPSRPDALDLIKDMQQKIEGNQRVPNYQIEALKEFLKDQLNLKEPLDQVIAILQKE